jgi:hypothetical protein
MGETLYQLISCVICFRFHDTFETHFSPHQFGVIIKGSCEAIIHGIMHTLNFHPDCIIFQLDVANVVNSMLRKVIFEKLRATNDDILQLIPFVHPFESPLLYNHYNCETM